MMTTAERVKLLREEIGTYETRVNLARAEWSKLSRTLSEKRLELEDVQRQQLAPMSTSHIEVR